MYIGQVTGLVKGVTCTTLDAIGIWDVKESDVVSCVDNTLINALQTPPPESGGGAGEDESTLNV